jgi:tetratricopeptide (TPR) repeat protein
MNNRTVLVNSRRPNLRWAASLVMAGVLISTGCEQRVGTPTIPVFSEATLDTVLAEALKQAREQVVNAPKSAEVWGRFGQNLEAAEFHAEARACYQRAVELEPISVRWLHLLGLQVLPGDADGGMAYLERAAELSGTTNDAPRVRLAQALVERGRFEEARRHLEFLTRATPGHAAAGLEWARMELAEQNLARAGQWLEPCLTNPYTARPAALLLSQVRAREGNGEAAQLLARRASGMPKPFDWPDSFQREVQALRMDRSKRAERVQGLVMQGRLDEAESELKALLAQAPEDPEGLLLAGRIALQRRDCVEAERRFREHLRVAGKTVNGLTQLALSMLCQQRWKEAEECLSEVLALKPDFAQAHANQAIARSRGGNAAGAIASYREALRCSPGDAGSHAGLAEEYARIGDRALAMEHVDRALALDPTHGKARALKARWGQ